jgi:hypothetical protein
MTLTPQQAAQAASSVYQLRLSDDMLNAAVGAPAVQPEFDIMGGSRLVGTTGAGPISRDTGFAYVANGTGNKQGEILISIRGTEKTSGHDWLTNARMAGTPGPSGYPVHAGFLALANRLLPQIRQEMADALRGRRQQAVKLYTFGAPRSGLQNHANYLTSTLGSRNIYRVYHHTDPVPMVPVFPYSHVPYEETAYLMRGPGTLISIEAHDVQTSYTNSVGTSNWNGLSLIRHPVLENFEAAQEWLEHAAERGGGMLSSAMLRMIMSALGWILRQVGRMVGFAVLGAATIIDQIAQLLYSGVLTGISISMLIGRLMAAIMRFTGRQLARGTNMTVAFFQYVLDLLFRTVAGVARSCLNALP